MKILHILKHFFAYFESLARFLHILKLRLHILKVTIKQMLWFEAFLPDGLDALTEVIEDVSALDAAPCG